MFLQHMSKTKQKHSQEKDTVICNTYIHTEFTEALVHFDCGTTESLENPSGATEWRNVLKVGHRVREGGKSVCA